jgi:hypothetical protein
MEIDMPLTRRGFLALAGTAMIGTQFSIRDGHAAVRTAGQGADKNTGAVWYSGIGNNDGSYSIARITSKGCMRRIYTTDQRFHGFALNTVNGDICAPARRPGRHFGILQNDQLAHRVSAGKGRHFYGHGTYSWDGNWPYLAENDFETVRGLLGVYDVMNGYVKSHEMDSGGVGPHELVLVPDTNLLIVANGRLQKHPDTGRAILNRDSFLSNIVHIDLKLRRIVSQKSAPRQRQSLRHIDVDRHKNTYIGAQELDGQISGDPLVSMLQPTGQYLTVDVPSDGWGVFRGYIGSICADKKQTILGASSPKAVIIGFWATNDLRYLGKVDIKDACGLA